ncbi:hypothetical protein ACSBR1_034459 [Camellia fascicularis]
MAYAPPHHLLFLFLLLFLLPFSIVARTNGTVAVGLTVDKGLVLSDPQGNELWKSLTIPDNVVYRFMNDTGNFVLVGSDSFYVWESFKHPTDTMLPTEIMESSEVINSRLSKTNFSQGRFQFRLLLDRNLVLNSRDVTTNFPYAAYYISVTYDPSNSSNSSCW